MHPYLIPLAVLEWMRTLEWVGPIEKIHTYYPAGHPENVAYSLKRDYYEANVSVTRDEMMRLEITDAIYEVVGPRTVRERIGFNCQPDPQQPAA